MFLKYSVTFLLFVFLKDSFTFDLKFNTVSFLEAHTSSKTTYLSTGFYERVPKIVESGLNSTELNSNLTFQNLTQDELYKLRHPFDTFYISPSKLASLRCDTLVNLTKESHDKDLNLFIKVLEGTEQRKQLTEFLDCLKNHKLSWNFLNILAEQLFKTPRTFKQALNFSMKIPMLAFYTAPSFLLESEEIDQTLVILYSNFLGHSFIENSTWNQLPLMSRKTLVHIILQNTILDKKSVLTNLPFVLEDLNLTALEEFQVFDYNISLINSIKWNAVQSRKLIDEKDEKNLLDQLPDEFLLYMLPRQVERLNQKVLKKMMNNLKGDDYLPFPIAVQLFKYIVPDIPKVLHVSDKNELIIMQKLLYTQNNTYLSQMFGKSLSMEASAKLNSPHYTFLQAYYILGEFKILNEKDKFLNLNELLAAIPTSAIVELFDHTTPEVYLIKLLSAPKGNKIRAAAIFKLYKKSGYENYIKLALQNEQNDFISISPLEIQANASLILQLLQRDESESLKRRTANLPTYILTELLRKDGDIIFGDNFNSSHPIYLAILGLNCEILSKIPITNFMPIFAYYNTQRKLYNKEFPKDLQKCAQMSFLSYLHDKAIKQLGDHNHKNIIQILDLVDIKSVGGYIMATLPVEQILLSQHYNEIIREIGSLSLPELMLAVPEDHLRTLTFKYLEKINTEIISLEYLLILGNLTHYLREEALKIIEPLALKLMIETKFLDTRICAGAAIRKIWAELLELTFGSPKIWKEDTVLAVADMLIAFEKRQLDNIDTFVRLNVADLFESNYLEEIPWQTESLPFYEVCLSTLSNNERTSYELSITNLSLFYAISIENQLKSILPVNKSNLMSISNLDEETNSKLSVLTLPPSLSRAKNSEDFEYPNLSNDFIINHFVDKFVTGPSSKISKNVSLSLENENIEQSTTAISDFTTFSEQLTTFNNDVLESTNELAENIETTGASSILNFDVTTTSKVPTNSETSVATLSFNDEMTESRVTSALETSPTTLSSNDITTELKVITALETLSTTLSNLVPSDLFTITIDEGFTKKSPTSNTGTATDAITNSTSKIEKENIKMTNDSTNSEILINEQKIIQTMDSQFTSTSASPSSLSSIAQASTIGNGITDNTGIGLTTKTINLPARLFNYTNYYSYTFPKTTVKSRDQREIKTKKNQISLSLDTNKLLTDMLRYYNRPKRETDLFNFEINLSCNTLKMLGPLSKFLIPSLNFTNEDFFNCIELIGQMKLSNAMKKKIWSSVKDKIPVPNLGFVAGNLLTEISTDDINSFNFNVEAEWGLEIVNILTNNQSISEQLNRKFRSDNKVNMKTLPIFTIIALRQAVCQFSADTLKELIQSDKNFLNIWSLFYTMDNCPKDCLKIMAEIAVDFFGNPHNWTPTIFAQLGPVVAGLSDEKWESNFIYHSHISAIRCLSEDKIKKLNHTVDIRKISLKAVEMLYRVHGNLLLSHPQILNSSSVKVVIENDYFIEKKKPIAKNYAAEEMNSEGKFLKPGLIIFWSFIFRYFM